MDRYRRSVRRGDKFCWFKDAQRVHEAHKMRMKNIKSSIDTATPKSHFLTHMRRNLKKERILREKSQRIEHENGLLLEKMGKVLESRSLDSKNQVLKFRHSLNSDLRRKKLRTITMSNHRLLERIHTAQSSYSSLEWRQHRKNVERYLQHMSDVDPVFTTAHSAQEALRLARAHTASPGKRKKLPPLSVSLTTPDLYVAKPPAEGKSCVLWREDARIADVKCEVLLVDIGASHPTLGEDSTIGVRLVALKKTSQGILHRRDSPPGVTLRVDTLMDICSGSIELRRWLLQLTPLDYRRIHFSRLHRLGTTEWEGVIKVPGARSFVSMPIGKNKIASSLGRFLLSKMQAYSHPRGDIELILPAVAREDLADMCDDWELEEDGDDIDLSLDTPHGFFSPDEPTEPTEAGELGEAIE